ncbi:galanin receptor 2b-like [Gigantopelta aegis]|uniref:galanin receptor 2b-like n=1 Tax=Gigantopelta aegis TaxID=1735272 RepID=UPI001B88AE8A|nr:galanin receptor 2b-like [Gigantopelta aegis]
MSAAAEDQGGDLASPRISCYQALWQQGGPREDDGLHRTIKFRSVINVYHPPCERIAVSYKYGTHHEGRTGLCLICIPMAVGQAVYKVWIYGEFMCKITAFLQGVSVCASILTITVLSMDRLLAIRHPMVFKRVSNCKMAGKTIVLIWIISVGVMAPLLAFRKTEEEQLPGESFQFCHESWPEDYHRQIYDSCLFVIVYIIPGVVIGVSYGLIGKQLWTEDEDLKRGESQISRGMSQKIMRGRKHVAKMLMALALVFAVCWLPYYIVSLYLDFQEESKIKDFLVILPFTILLGHVNSALNPILYFYTSKCFRRYLLKLVSCKRESSRHGSPVDVVVNVCNSDNTLKSRAVKKTLVHLVSPTPSSCTRTYSLPFSRLNSLKSNADSNSSIKRQHYRDFSKPADLPTILLHTTENQVVARNGLDSNKPHDPSHQREIMASTLSIPTTIQEESSRSRPSSPGSLSHYSVIREESTIRPEMISEVRVKSSEPD